MKRMGLMTAGLAALLLLWTGCSSPAAAGGGKKTLKVAITALALDNSSLNMEVGDQVTLGYTLTPANANTGVTWTSDDEDVVTVNNATVTAVGAGYANVTLASTLDPSIIKTVSLHVVAAGALVSIADQFTFFNQTGVLSDSTQSLPELAADVLTLGNTNTDSLVKTSLERNTMVYYSTALTGDFTFKARVKMLNRATSSADRGVTVAAYAKTDGDFGINPPMAGLLFRARGDIRSYYAGAGGAYSAGSPNLEPPTSIPANTYDVERDVEVKRTSTGYTFSIYVPKTGALESSGTATANVPNASLHSGVTGTSPVYLAITVGGVTANFSNIKIVDDSNAATLYQSGTVAASPVAVKAVTVTGTLLNNDSTYQYQNSLAASGADIQLTATVAPSYADNTAVTWSTSNAAIATVSGSGLVDIVGAGDATITATTVDNGFTGTYRINISDGDVAVTGVSVSVASSLLVGLSTYAKATIAPTHATNQVVTWSSSNEAVATVDSTTGAVTAVAAGTANIVATATDGSGKTGSAGLTVSAFVTPIWKWDAATDSTFSITNPPAKVNGYTVTGRSATGLVFNATTGLSLGNNRFVLGSAYYDATAGGATLGATTGSFTPPDGEFNFTKKAKITITFGAVTGTGNFTVYLNNNTTSDSATTSMMYQAADAGAGLSLISSKVFEGGVATLGASKVFYVDPAVFTKNSQLLSKSFLQFRVASATTLLITGITIEYEP